MNLPSIYRWYMLQGQPSCLTAAHSQRSSEMSVRMHDFVCVDEVANPDRLKSATEDAVFERAVGDGEAVMLPLMLRPGIDHECFEIFSGVLRVVVNAPARGAIAPTNPLVGVNGVEKLRRAMGIDFVFDGHEDGALVRRGFGKQDGFSPVVPDIKRGAGFGKPKRKTQDEAGRDSNAGDQQRGLRARSPRRESPCSAADRHAPLEYEQVDGEHARANPVGRELLDEGIENRHEDRPRRTSETQEGTKNPHAMDLRSSEQNHREHDGGGRHDGFDGVGFSCALERDSSENRADPEKTEQQAVRERTTGQARGDGRQQSPKRAGKENNEGRAQEQNADVGRVAHVANRRGGCSGQRFGGQLAA